MPSTVKKPALTELEKLKRSFKRSTGKTFLQVAKERLEWQLQASGPELYADAFCRLEDAYESHGGDFESDAEYARAIANAAKAEDESEQEGLEELRHYAEAIIDDLDRLIEGIDTALASPDDDTPATRVEDAAVKPRLHLMK